MTNPQHPADEAFEKWWRSVGYGSQIREIFRAGWDAKAKAGGDCSYPEWPCPNDKLRLGG